MQKQPNTEKPGIEAKGGENRLEATVLDEKKEEQKKEQERTTTKKKLFLDYYKATLGSILAVCKKIEIGYSTFKDWRKDDATFAQALLDADDEIVLMHREQLKEHIIKKNLRALTYYLDRRDPLFKPHSEVETHITPTKTMKQIIDEYEQENIDEPAGGGIPPADQKQEGADKTIQEQPGATDILGPKNEEKPVVKTQAEGAK